MFKILVNAKLEHQITGQNESLYVVNAVILYYSLNLSTSYLPIFYLSNLVSFFEIQNLILHPVL